jgi:hypothetical protein
MLERKYQLYALFVIQVYLASQFCPLKKNVCLRTPARYVFLLHALNALLETKLFVLNIFYIGTNQLFKYSVCSIGIFSYIIFLPHNA